MSISQLECILKLSDKNEEDCNEFDDAQLVTDVLRYAQGKGYRSDCSKNSKRSIRRKAKRFVVDNGDVHYRKKNGTLVSIYMYRKQGDPNIQISLRLYSFYWSIYYTIEILSIVLDSS